MPRVRLKVKPPGGLFAFTEEHPDDDFAILSAYPADDELLVILKAVMDAPEDLVEFFEGSTFVRDFEVRHSDEESLVVGYSLPFVPPPVRAIFDAGELPRFPVRIKDGYVFGEMTTSHERLSLFKEGLEATDIPFEILSVLQTEPAAETLTERQQEFVATGLELGYYDTPRRCTLTGVAERLDVSKATASNVLHRAEEQIIKEFFWDTPL